MNKELHETWLKNVDKDFPKLEEFPFSSQYPKIKKTIHEPPIEYGKDLFPLFNCINIETTSWCNMNCPFCPSIYLNREKRFMSDELFTKIILQLSSLGFKEEIRLHQSNEPLLDKNLADKIKLTKKYNPKAIVGFHSNCLLLTFEKLEEFYKSGLNFLAAEAYKSKEQFEKYYELFSKFKEKYPKIIFNYQTENGKYSFLQKKEKYKNTGFFITLSRRYPKKDINNENFFDYNKSKITSRIGIINSKINCKKTNICTRPFRTMQVNFNGKVSVCCEEWLYAGIVGDLNKNSIVDIWNGKPIMEFRNRLQDGDRTVYPCNKCNFSGGVWLKNIRRVKI